MQFRPRSASGVIVAGGTAQVLMPANAGRMGWWLQNTSGGDLWIDDGDAGAPAQIPIEGTRCDAFRVAAGETWHSASAGQGSAAWQGPISIFGAASGQTFSCREF